MEHDDRDPEYSVLRELRSIKQSLSALHRKVDIIMAQDDDLTAAVKALSDDITAELAAIANKLGASASDPVVAAAITQLNVLAANVSNETNSLTAPASPPTGTPLLAASVVGASSFFVGSTAGYQVGAKFRIDGGAVPVNPAQEDFIVATINANASLVSTLPAQFAHSQGAMVNPLP